MSTASRQIIGWEAAGVVFIVAVGSALHFAFAWSGKWVPLATIAAVNESIWEHLKLAFWPGLAWAALESRRLGLRPYDFWAAKGIALLVAPILIVVIFVSYTNILGRNILALDIGTFVIAVIAGQAISAWLLVLAPGRGNLRKAGCVLLACQVIAYATLTYFPPRLPLFMEMRSGVYGIPATGAR
jgi:hypothetical protein